MLNLALPDLTNRLTTERHKLSAGKSTVVHVAKYHRADINLKIVAFKEATFLIDWCKENGVTEALNGGFFCRHSNLPLGDIVVNNLANESAPISGEWGELRGCITVNKDKLGIAPRFAAKNFSSLMQAGPILLKNGVNMVGNGNDWEGFSAGAADFDSDITNGRYPRAAIGFDDTFIWSVVVEGYSPDDSGMTLYETAEYMRGLGAADALNLDGGGSATLISGGNLINRPRTRDLFYPSGRAIYSAIIFEKADL